MDFMRFHYVANVTYSITYGKTLDFIGVHGYFLLFLVSPVGVLWISCVLLWIAVYPRELLWGNTAPAAHQKSPFGISKVTHGAPVNTNITPQRPCVNPWFYWCYSNRIHIMIIIRTLGTGGFWCYQCNSYVIAMFSMLYSRENF